MNNLLIEKESKKLMKILLVAKEMKKLLVEIKEYFIS